MTPKAPPDIDKWMIDPPGSNISTSLLIARNLVAPLIQLNQSLSDPVPEYEVDTAPSRGFWLDVFIVVMFGPSLMGTIFLLSLLCWRVLRALYLRSPLSWNHQLPFLEAWFSPEVHSYIRTFFKACGIAMCIGTCVYLWNYFRQHESWSAASDFLASCKTQQVQPPERFQ